ncbi:Creatinase/aminopeptidase-like [Sesbania bispinosa]|nr:Creatinase/aminopeptidase-like [Sesbania bispinosa]
MLIVSITSLESPLHVVGISNLVKGMTLLLRMAPCRSTQECFKSSWSLHKSVHLKAKLISIGTQNSDSLGEGWLYCVKGGQGRTPKLPHFEWTGALRPYPISSKRIVPAHIDRPDWADDGIPKVEPNSDLQHTVEIKSPDQIERMRETCRVSSLPFGLL